MWRLPPDPVRKSFRNWRKFSESAPETSLQPMPGEFGYSQLRRNVRNERHETVGKTFSAYSNSTPSNPYLETILRTVLTNVELF